MFSTPSICRVLSATFAATGRRAVRRAYCECPAAAASPAAAKVAEVCRVGIIGVPFDKGQKVNTEFHEGPKSIRDGGLIAKIQEFNEWTDIVDYGDIPVDTSSSAATSASPDAPPNMLNYHQVLNTMRHLSDRVCQVLADGRLCITLGGDHSMGFGTLDGHLRHNPDAIVFWVDAHADINTNATSASGSMHGMPVALGARELTGCWPPGVAAPMGDEWRPKLSLRNVVYIGLRSVDPLERLIADQHDMLVFGMEDVDRHGIRRVMEMALEKVDPRGERGIHISFDIDALDALEAPSTGTPVRGGLTLREGLYIVEHLQRTGRLEAIDLAEVNPAIGSAEDVRKTVSAAIHLLAAACGTRRAGNRPRKETEIPSCTQ